MIIPTVYGMLLMLLIAGVRKYDVFISMQNMVVTRKTVGMVSTVIHL